MTTPRQTTSSRPRIAALLAALTLVGAACGTSSEAAENPGAESANTERAGDVAVFDASVVHDISVTFDDAEYESMLDTFTDTGEKEWIEATVTIDGTTYEQVGLRLKGNSSLRGLTGGGGPGGATADDGSVDSPEDLPWLIRLDEFVDGQTHQGYEDLVVRSNNTETSMNEAVALALLDEAGLASEQAMATRFSVNGSDEVLRLTVEHPSDDIWYEANFDGDGALYKAESTGDWSYRGDDEAAYEDVFDQEGGDDVADLAPLTEFLDFVNNSSDEEFAADLPERLDVDAFATYLAMMEVVQNFDDIDGPGNNAYLWWDADSDRFTVVPWDLNLAFGVQNVPGGGGADAGGGFGGGELPEGVEPPTGGAFPEGVEPPTGGAFPEGVEPPTGGELPDDFEPPAGGRGGDRGGFGGGAGGPGGGTNPLVERFHENDTFAALYEERLEELRSELIDGGVLDELVATWSGLLTEQAADLVDAATVEQDAAVILDG